MTLASRHYANVNLTSSIIISVVTEQIRYPQKHHKEHKQSYN